MKKTKSASNYNYSNDHLCYEALVCIFMALNVADLAVVSLVCKSWNLASRDPTLWRKLDLTGLSSRNFNIPMIISTWMDRPLSTKITQFLKYALSLSDGSTNCLVFNYYVYLTDAHLITAAKGTPNLKRLVLPLTGKLTKIGISTAMRLWGGLESITITSLVSKSDYIFSACRKYCINITELKFTCIFGQEDAEAMVKYTPNLKRLSVRSIIVNMRAICRVLNELEHLEEVNICHSLIMDRPVAEVELYSIRDLRNRLNISCMRKLIICERRWCLRCKNRRDNTDSSRQPYGWMEDIWREDEIASLAHW